MAPNTMSSAGIAFLKRKEGFSPTPYRDAGGYSIGYGHFIKPGEKFTRITPAQGEALLRADVANAEKAVREFVKVPLSQGQFDALVSFIYNVGTGAFRNSTLLRYINQRAFSAAANEFARWNQAEGKVLSALVARRAEEKAMFLA